MCIRDRPENYDAAQRYPLVLFLHGGGERGRDNERQLTHGGSLWLRPENRGLIVLAPQCPPESYWASVGIDRSTAPITLTFNYSNPITPPLRAALEVVEKLKAEEQVDASRVYVTGLSMGGMGTFEAVYRKPGLFAAAAAICGGGDTAAYNPATARVPFRVYHGDADAVVSVSESRKMVRRLQGLNANVEYIEYEGVNHNSWDNAFAENDFVSWLLKFSKK